MRIEIKDLMSWGEKSPHLVLSNNISLTNPPGLASEGIFLSVPNGGGVHFNPHRAHFIITLTLNAIFWL